MNIVSVTWARNEADIIETFVRYHCSIVDRMVIVDHRSTDGTREILEKLKGEGLPLDIRHDESLVNRQGDVVTESVRGLRDEDPDWILPLDCDEFITPVNGEASVREVLQSLPAHTVPLIRWRSYVPLPGDSAHEAYILRRIRHRRKEERIQWYKVALSRTFIGKDIEIRLGSHTIIDGENVVPYALSKTLAIAHFPVRSASQIMKKVIGGHLSNTANHRRIPGSVFQWKYIFDILKERELLDAGTLRDLALFYASEQQWDALPPEWTGGKTLHELLVLPANATENVSDALIEDPLPAPFPLRYTSESDYRIGMLLDDAERLACEVARLSGELEQAGKL